VKHLEQGALDAPQYYPKAQIRQGADRSAEREGQSLPPAHRGARVIRTDALRFMLILQEPRGGQERKQDSEDDPDINAHQNRPDGFYSYFNPRHHPQLSAQPSLRRLSRTACPVCWGIAMSA